MGKTSKLAKSNSKMNAKRHFQDVGSKWESIDLTSENEVTPSTSTSTSLKERGNEMNLVHNVPTCDKIEKDHNLTMENEVKPSTSLLVQDEKHEIMTDVAESSEKEERAKDAKQNSNGKRARYVTIDEMCKNKKLKVDGDIEELPEDVLLFEETSDTGITVKLFFDVVLSMMTILVNHVKEAKRTQIALTEEEAIGYSKRIKTAISVCEKYTHRRLNKPLDLAFKLHEGDSNYFSTYLFCKQASYVAGEIILDMRKFHKKEDNTYMYTKQGVRLSPEKGEMLHKMIERCLSTIKRHVDRSSESLAIVKCWCLAKTIRELRASDNIDCYGCTVKHPSQREHMQRGGSLEEWEDIVNELWEAAYGLVDDEDVVTKTDDALPQGIVTSTRRDIPSIRRGIKRNGS
ncbi:hypothetical protein ACF0H5_022960 [Mactra antiquata]